MNFYRGHTQMFTFNHIKDIECAMVSNGRSSFTFLRSINGDLVDSACSAGIVQYRLKISKPSNALPTSFRFREGVQISGHTDADADQSGPHFFRFHLNRYRLKWNRQWVKLLHRANYRHHQFLTYICQHLSKDCNRQSRYVLLTKIMLGDVYVNKSEAWMIEFSMYKQAV